MNIKLVGSRLMSVLMACLASLAAIALFSQSPALADGGEGARLFNGNCAACHAGGLNRVIAAKTLKIEALRKYNMDSVDAITKQVTKGKGAMPAFGKKLTADEIGQVANYVLERANQGWKKV
jgi:cytochrome c6